jgi:hypothetical protein
MMYRYLYLIAAAADTSGRKWRPDAETLRSNHAHHACERRAELRDL